MDYFQKQLRLSIRRLARSPMFAFVTLLTLAISIGASAAIFAVINGVLLKPLPYPDPERLVGVWQSLPALNFPDLPLSPADYFTFRDENRTFEHFGLWRVDTAGLTGSGEPEEARALSVTDGIFQALGVQPSFGRRFSAEDDSPGSPESVILMYAYWQRRFGGDPSVLGRSIVVNSRAREIIGVMPQSFRFLDERPDLILPLQLDRAKVLLGQFNYRGIARLKPEITLAAVNADVARMIPIVNTRFAPPPGFSLKMFAEAPILPQVRPLKVDVIGDIGKVLWILMGTAGIVLVIACANVANLLLVRAEGRQQELAIRAALGAGSTQIAEELLSESLFLALGGGALGVGLAYAGLRILVASAPAALPRLDNISVDFNVLFFSIAISLVTGFLFGLLPVLKYATPHLADRLRRGGRTISHTRERHRARNTLVVVQIALALVLLISSGLMIRTFMALKKVQPGFTEPQTLQTFRIRIPEADVKEPERVIRIQQDIQQNIAAIPGVSSVAFTSSVPMDNRNNNDPIYVEGQTYTEAQIPPIRRFKSITPGFLQTMGTRLIVGRDLTWADLHEKRQIVLISENLAREFWAEPAAAIGKRIRENSKSPWHEIVGVVQDIYDDGVAQKPPAIVYWPMITAQFENSPIFVSRAAAYAVRSDRAGSDGFLRELRKAVWAANPNLPIAAVQTMDEIYRSSIERTSFTLVMLAIAATMALLLGIVGVYGVMSYAISQRTREIGIRMALGARHQDVKRMFIRYGLLLAASGAAFGLAVAAAVSRLMLSLLFGVNAIDPLTYAVVTSGLVAAALAASYFPARKAALVNPVETLKAE